ncbi:MAG: LamG domain-containing protein, partial [Gammaproteobacteria bacterium]|nr:LamG domain-containing protein [Gammaproteobacteria bacterium]
MESGAFTINATTGGSPSFTAQSFQQTYDTVPVVFILTTNRGGDITVVRIRNVTTTGFEAVMVEDPSENGPHINMPVHYFAIEPGVHTMTVVDELLGSRTITIDAGVLSTSNVVCGFGPPPVNCPGSFTTQMTNDYSPLRPVVLAQLQTFVNGIAGVPPTPPQPWITASLDNVLTDRFDVAIDRHEVNLGSLTGAEAALEQIGYVVFDSDLTAADFNANNAAAVLVELETIRVDPPLPPAADGWDDGCNENINFSKSLPSRLVMATKQTRLESDGGWLRRCNLTNARVRVVVEEDGVGDAERSKTLRDGVGVVVFSRGFFFDSTFVPPTASTSFKIEADEITLVPGTPLTVTLRQFYEQAPAVFLLIDSSNPEPTAVRVIDVTTDLAAGTTSFTAVAVEPQGATGGGVPSTPGGTASSVHYVALEKGLFNFPDGTLVEVGDVPVTAVQQNFAGADSFQTVTLSTTFPSPPVVLAQIIGVANTPADPAVPWLTVAYQTNSTTTGSFAIALERSEVNAGGPIALPETVAYMAIEPGLIGSFLDNSGNAIRGEAQRSLLNGLALSGWNNICFNAGVLGMPFLDLTYSIPPLVVAHEMSHIGGDGGWHRRCNLTTSHVRIAEDEDQFANAERVHIWEETGLVAFSEAFDADFSLFAFYEMEEPVWNNGAAGQVDNTVDTVLDGTPIDNALTAVTTPAFTALPESTCRYGSFDGSGDLGAVSDGVEIGTTDLALVDELTVSAWVRWAVNPPSGNNRAVYVQNDTPTNFNDYQFALRGNANNRRFEFRVQTVSGSQQTQTANIVSVNTWYHVTGVYDGSEVRIYVDDVLQDTAAHSGDFVAFNSNRVLNIGKSTNAAANDHGINGLIDEVRLYRRALSLDEIRTIRRFTRPCSGGHDHYAIDHVGAGGGFGVTCEAEAVTISSHEVSHVSAAPPAGTVMTITATPGDSWALGSIGNPGSFSDLGGGVAQYIFDGSEIQIELLLSQTSPAVVSFGITDTLGRGIGVGEGPTLEFRDVILQFSPVGVQVAGKSETFSVQVIETGGSGAC